MNEDRSLRSLWPVSTGRRSSYPPRPLARHASGGLLCLRIDRGRPVVAGLIAPLLIACLLVVFGCRDVDVTSPSQPSLPVTSERGSSSSVTAPPGSLETATTAKTGSYQTVTVEDLATALAGDPTAQLVDVREPAEWADTGVIAEALLISLGELETRAPEELDESRPVYVICRSGNRSRAGAETLVQLGFEQVYNVSGGMAAWIEAGLPVVAYGG